MDPLEILVDIDFKALYLYLSLIPKKQAKKSSLSSFKFIKEDNSYKLYRDLYPCSLKNEIRYLIESKAVLSTISS